MRVTELGHVSLFVRDLDTSVAFYRDRLGLHETGRGKGGRIAFLSAGVHHHDVSLELARTDGASPPRALPASTTSHSASAARARPSSRPATSAWRSAWTVT